LHYFIKITALPFSLKLKKQRFLKIIAQSFPESYSPVSPKLKEIFNFKENSNSKTPVNFKTITLP
jgi:hypothetical protein